MTATITDYEMNFERANAIFKAVFDEAVVTSHKVTEYGEVELTAYTDTTDYAITVTIDTDGTRIINFFKDKVDRTLVIYPFKTCHFHCVRF